MKVKVFGKRELIHQVIGFRDNKFVITLRIRLNIKDPDICFPTPNYRDGKTRTNVRYITISGYYRTDNTLIILIPETEEESEIIHCTFHLKQNKSVITIVFINNWDAEKIVDKKVV